MFFDFGLMLLQNVFIGNFAICINLVINGNARRQFQIENIRQLPVGLEFLIRASKGPSLALRLTVGIVNLTRIGINPRGEPGT